MKCQDRTTIDGNRSSDYSLKKKTFRYIVRTSFGLVEIVFVKKMWNVDDIERFGENR